MDTDNDRFSPDNDYAHCVTAAESILQRLIETDHSKTIDLEMLFLEQLVLHQLKERTARPESVNSMGEAEKWTSE